MPSSDNTDNPKIDPEAQRIVKIEADNGVEQHDLGINIIKTFLEPERPFALQPSHIMELQRLAVKGIERQPGQWRTGPVGITKSRHQPPEAHLVGFLVQEMCDYVNRNLHEETPFHLAAYVMWRLNWIHPFTDGNGRTSRIVSYIVLSVALKTLLPGTPSIPQQIEANRAAYFRALEAADEMQQTTGKTDVSVMEEMLKNMLARQLLSVIEKAGGKALTS